MPHLLASILTQVSGGDELWRKLRMKVSAGALETVQVFAGGYHLCGVKSAR